MNKELTTQGFTLQDITASWLTKGTTVKAFYSPEGELLAGTIKTLWNTMRDIKNAPVVWQLCVELGKESK